MTRPLISGSRGMRCPECDTIWIEWCRDVYTPSIDACIMPGCECQRVELDPSEPVIEDLVWREGPVEILVKSYRVLE